jgi:hypothetical protein
VINIAYSKTALVKILKESGYSHPLLPLAVGILLDAYESGEAPGGPVLNPAGTLIAELGGKPHQKRKRKASAYNKEYAKQYKKLKKKHPRTKFSVLAKRAHRATKKVRK